MGGPFIQAGAFFGRIWYIHQKLTGNCIFQRAIKTVLEICSITPVLVATCNTSWTTVFTLIEAPSQIKFPIPINPHTRSESFKMKPKTFSSLHQLSWNVNHLKKLGPSSESFSYQEQVLAVCHSLKRCVHASVYELGHAQWSYLRGWSHQVGSSDKFHCL